MNPVVLRTIPILGWLFIGFGLLRPVRALSVPLRLVFWIDVVLSVGVHAAQIPAARRAAGPGVPLGRVVAMTMLFGATWWKTL
ncbi:hypothetical protein [Nocardia camponoti]|uniref:Uncharacterized protein n=1 Tax=Nocardia camponoti TaxID=1616106 RepID=A0A917QE28_9NOCA|nr:hypothetical protein [Nocardia camponoti]GGK46170.1 hypothetical protein GCM10011591_16980 [Nocardia camponoti]